MNRRSFLASGIALPAAATAAPAPGLRYRTLGKTGLKVTTLGFGCMLVADDSVVARGLDMGLNFFDTARSYQGGNNERMVGSVLKGRRKDVVIETKTPGRTPAAILADLDKSLSELGTDYVDIWYLHARNTPAEISDELLEAQQAAKKAGKIRFAGVSTHYLKDIVDHVIQKGKTDVLLVTYNFSMGPENRIEESIKKARDAGIGIVAMKVMAGGFARIQRGDRLFGADPAQVTQRLKREGAMPAALKWALKNNSVDTAIVGITDIEQLEENFAAMSAPYGATDEKVLAAHLERIGPLYCRMCGECRGQCPKGLPVADMLRILAYADGYGQFPLARERYRELPAEVAAVRCHDCVSCAVRCPNGVNVMGRLAKAQSWLA